MPKYQIRYEDAKTHKVHYATITATSAPAASTKFNQASKTKINILSTRRAGK